MPSSEMSPFSAATTDVLNRKSNDKCRHETLSQAQPDLRDFFGYATSVDAMKRYGTIGRINRDEESAS
jgi:hypothetical protein